MQYEERKILFGKPRPSEESLDGFRGVLRHDFWNKPRKYDVKAPVAEVEPQVSEGIGKELGMSVHDFEDSISRRSLYVAAFYDDGRGAITKKRARYEVGV